MEQNHLIQKNYMLRKILKTVYNALLASLILFVTLQFTACSNLPEPAPTGEKLPFGVFPLNDVKWVEEDKYTDWYDVTKSYIDTITYFVRQIAENKAELYKTVKRTITVWNKDLLINTVTIEPKLLANIYLEGKKSIFR